MTSLSESPCLTYTLVIRMKFSLSAFGYCIQINIFPLNIADYYRAILIRKYTISPCLTSLSLLKNVNVSFYNKCCIVGMQ